jgi:nucleotide-binding universal stress UspA family protein
LLRLVQLQVHCGRPNKEMRTMKQPILVATDGTAGSDGALRLAAALAAREQRSVVVLTVLEPVVMPSIGASYPLVLPDAGLLEDQAERLHAVVAEQIRGLAADGQLDVIEIEIGPPAATIVRRALEIDAQIIVIGIGRHDVTDRWLGTETALKVIQLAHVPVLAAHPEALTLPARALVGMDFSEYARDAARAACDVIGGVGEVHLAHVAWGMPSGDARIDEGGWLKTYRIGAAARLTELRRDLQAHCSTRISTTLLEGETSRALIKYARMLAVDLIATGSHGYRLLDRMLMGSVSTRILRQSPCSVLVAPPRSVALQALQARDASARRAPRELAVTV